jgi:hypothetical protein
LKGIVDFVAILLKVPQEVFGVQAVSSRLMLLMVCWCLHPDVVVALRGVAYMLTCGQGGCS